MAPSTLTVEERILAASAKRDGLLNIIAGTQSAATTLTQVKLDLASLNGKAWDLRATWHDVKDTAAREQEEYEDIRDSSVRKLFMGSDKYNELLRKEEGEHVQAQEWLDKARAAADAADALVEDTKKKRDKLEKQKEQHLEAEIALEELYNSVFDGPVPNNLEEDRLRAQLAEAQEVGLGQILDDPQGTANETSNRRSTAL
jgi:hypothetical protein